MFLGKQTKHVLWYSWTRNQLHAQRSRHSIVLIDSNSSWNAPGKRRATTKVPSENALFQNQNRSKLCDRWRARFFLSSKLLSSFADFLSMPCKEHLYSSLYILMFALFGFYFLEGKITPNCRQIHLQMKNASRKNGCWGTPEIFLHAFLRKWTGLQEFCRRACLKSLPNLLKKLKRLLRSCAGHLLFVLWDRAWIGGIAIERLLGVRNLLHCDCNERHLNVYTLKHSL